MASAPSSTPPATPPPKSRVSKALEAHADAMIAQMEEAVEQANEHWRAYIASRDAMWAEQAIPVVQARNAARVEVARLMELLEESQGQLRGLERAREGQEMAIGTGQEDERVRALVETLQTVLGDALPLAITGNTFNDDERNSFTQITPLSLDTLHTLATSLSTQHTELQGQLASLERARTEQETAHTSTLNSHREAMEAKDATHAEELAAKDSAYAEQTAAQDRVHAELEANHSSRMQGLQTRLDAAVQEAAAHQARITQLSDERNALQRERDAARQDLSAVQQAADEAAAEQESQQEAAREGGVHDATVEAAAQIGRFRLERNDAQHAARVMQGERDAAMRERDGLRREREGSEQKMEGQRRVTEGLEKILKEAQRVMRDALEKAQKAETQLGLAKAEAEQAKEDAQNAKENLDKANKETVRATEESSSVRAALDFLQADLAQVQDELAHVQAELDEARVAASLTAPAESQETATQLQEHLQTETTRADEALARIAVLEQELEAARSHPMDPVQDDFPPMQDVFDDFALAPGSPPAHTLTPPPPARSPSPPLPRPTPFRRRAPRSANDDPASLQAELDAAHQRADDAEDALRIERVALRAKVEAAQRGAREEKEAGDELRANMASLPPTTARNMEREGRERDMARQMEARVGELEEEMRTAREAERTRIRADEDAAKARAAESAQKAEENEAALRALRQRADAADERMTEAQRRTTELQSALDAAHARSFAPSSSSSQARQSGEHDATLAAALARAAQAEDNARVQDRALHAQVEAAQRATATERKTVVNLQRQLASLREAEQSAQKVKTEGEEKEARIRELEERPAGMEQERPAGNTGGSAEGDAELVQELVERNETLEALLAAHGLSAPGADASTAMETVPEPMEETGVQPIEDVQMEETVGVVPSPPADAPQPEARPSRPASTTRGSRDVPRPTASASPRDQDDFIASISRSHFYANSPANASPSATNPPTATAQSVKPPSHTVPAAATGSTTTRPKRKSAPPPGTWVTGRRTDRTGSSATKNAGEQVDEAERPAKKRKSGEGSSSVPVTAFTSTQPTTASAPPTQATNQRPYTARPSTTATVPSGAAADEPITPAKPAEQGDRPKKKRKSGAAATQAAGPSNYTQSATTSSTPQARATQAQATPAAGSSSTPMNATSQSGRKTRSSAKLKNPKIRNPGPRGTLGDATTAELSEWFAHENPDELNNILGNRSTTREDNDPEPATSPQDARRLARRLFQEGASSTQQPESGSGSGHNRALQKPSSSSHAASQSNNAMPAKAGAAPSSSSGKKGKARAVDPAPADVDPPPLPSPDTAKGKGKKKAAEEGDPSPDPARPSTSNVGTGPSPSSHATANITTRILTSPTLDAPAKDSAAASYPLETSIVSARVHSPVRSPSPIIDEGPTAIIRVRPRNAPNEEHYEIPVALSTSANVFHGMIGAMEDVPLHVLRVQVPNGDEWAMDSTQTLQQLGVQDDCEVIWWRLDQ